MLITRRLEFDAGQRIPDHKSQCRHLHGHRYALEITRAGDIIRSDDDPATCRSFGAATAPVGWLWQLPVCYGDELAACGPDGAAVASR